MVKVFDLKTLSMVEPETPFEQITTIGDAIQANKRTIFKLMADWGITRLTLDFDGSGDDGQVSIGGTDGGTVAENTPIDTWFVTATRDWFRSGTTLWTIGKQHMSKAYEFFDALVCQLVDEVEEDWVNGPGGWGDVTIDIEADAVALDLNVRIEDSRGVEATY